MTRLSLDYETAGIDLRKHGLDNYRRSARALLCSYKFDDGPTLLWDHSDGKSFPRDVREALLDPHVEKWAFNAQFERTITRDVLHIDTPYEGWRCTMVLAYMHSFIGTLADVGTQMNLPDDFKKMESEGKQMIRLFCAEQKVTEKQPHRWRSRETDPEKWELFRQYCIRDTDAEHAIWRRLSKFPVLPFEWRLYEIDQIINDRGKPIDVAFVRNALAMAARRKGELKDRLVEITGLDNPNSTTQLLPWLKVRGYPFNDLNKDSVSKALRENKEFDTPFLDDEAVSALKVRQWAARMSVAKHTAIEAVADLDEGVVRYLYQFAGASRTNRWAGRKVQTQNLPRTPKVIEEEPLLEAATAIIRSGDYDALDLFHDEPMEIIVGTVRSAFGTQEGEEFSVCDLASIESVSIGYLARCERILQVFRDGKDVYLDFGQELFRKTYDEITKAERGISKPAVLGAGYRLSGGQLSPEGKRTGLWGYAENMGIDMTQAQARESVRVFREEYAPEVVQMWKDYENAAFRALRSEKPQRVGPIVFEWMKPYLTILLPSSRRMYYYKPRIERTTIATGRMVTRPSRGMFEDGAEVGEMVEVEETYERDQLTYMGVSQITKQWQRIPTHGGKLTENVVQAFARDILAVGMTRAHDAGFDLRGHVHDELIALRSVNDSRYSWEALRECMTAPIEWAPGLPLGGAGWHGSFYRKD